MPEELAPILHTQSTNTAIQWYARLGFELEGEHQFVKGMPIYVFLRRGPIILHLSEHQGDAKPGTLSYMFVHDLDAIATEFAAEIIEQPWRREVHLTDPDGNRWRIGERKS